MRKAILFGVVAFLLSLTQPARAQFCPGVSPWVFDDVAASDPFCGYITWMAENGITLGCVTIDANHRLYCPNANVTRAAMAAFMNRLGNVRVEAVDTGPGLTGGPITSTGTISLAATQLLPTTACATNQVPKWNGTAWACANDASGTGTVTSVASGTGLTGGPITGSGTLAVAASYQLPQACASGQVAKSNGAGGWTCASDANSGGTVTSVATGAGLAGGPITASGTITLASSQLLPTVACALKQVPQWNGSAWTCSTPGTFTGNIDLPASTATVGNVTKPGGAFLHDFGAGNIFAGMNAGNFTTTGTSNTAIGANALGGNTTGNDNTAAGSLAMIANTTGSGNTAVGRVSAGNNTTGSRNAALGNNTLLFSQTGDDNSAVGYNALFGNISGSGNTALGSGALLNNTAGQNNIAVGAAAGSNISGDSNIAIGNLGSAAESQTIRIGSNQTRTFIAGIRGTTTESNDTVNVVVDTAGQLGTISSSRNAKSDIAEMGEASAALMQLRPVTFHYRADRASPQRLHYGLIAEEVAEVFPGLVARTPEGRVETVMYQFLAPMLLNEYQKQRHAIESERAQRAAEIAELRAERDAQALEIAALKAAYGTEMAELRRAVEVILARTSPDGRVAAR